MDPRLQHLLNAAEIVRRNVYGLVQGRHIDYETFEEPGTIAFEAILSMVDVLPVDLVQEAIALVANVLHACPSHLQREVAGGADWQTLVHSPSWPLIRSLTYVVTNAGETLGADGERAIAGLEHLCISTWGTCRIEMPLVSKVAKAVEKGPLRSLEMTDYYVEEQAENAFSNSGVVSRLSTLQRATQGRLQAAKTLSLERVGCHASAEIIATLNERGAGVRELSVHALDDEADEIVGALLRAPTLLQQLTRLEIGFELRPGHWERIVASPHLHRLVHLSLNPGQIGNNHPNGIEFQALGKSPFLKTLESLEIRFAPIGDEGWQRLAALPLPSLRELRLVGTRASDRGMGALAEANWLKNVTTLAVDDNEIGPEGMVALAAAHENLQSLQEVTLYDNPLYNEGVAALADATMGNNFRHLSVGNTGAQGVAALANARWMKRLESLGIGTYYCEPSEDVLLPLAEQGNLSSLVALLVQGMVGDEGVIAIASAASLRQLRSLNLMGDVTARSVSRLAQSPGLAGLWRLRLANSIGSQGDDVAFALAASDTLRSLVELDIFPYFISLDASRALAESDVVRMMRNVVLSGEVYGPWLESSKASWLLKERLRGRIAS